MRFPISIIGSLLVSLQILAQQNNCLSLYERGAKNSQSITRAAVAVQKETSAIPVIELHSKIIANLHETMDGRRWSTELVQSSLKDITNKVRSAAENTRTRESLNHLIMIEEHIAAELRDSYAWPSYEASAIKGVLTRINDHAKEVYRIDTNPSIPQENINITDYQSKFFRIKARVQANLVQTQDGRKWSIPLVKRVLNEIRDLNTEVLNSTSDPTTLRALIANREFIDRELIDSVAWPSYSAGAANTFLSQILLTINSGVSKY